MIPLPNPIIIYAAGGAMLLGFAAGYKVRSLSCEAAQTHALEKAIEQKESAQNEVVRRSAAYEATKDQAVRIERQTVERLRLVYRDKAIPAVSCAADPDTVRLLQGSLDYANSETAGKSGS